MKTTRNDIDRRLRKGKLRRRYTLSLVGVKPWVSVKCIVSHAQTPRWDHPGEVCILERKIILRLLRLPKFFLKLLKRFLTGQVSFIFNLQEGGVVFNNDATPHKAILRIFTWPWNENNRTIWAWTDFLEFWLVLRTLSEFWLVLRTLSEFWLVNCPSPGPQGVRFSITQFSNRATDSLSLSPRVQKHPPLQFPIRATDSQSLCPYMKHSTNNKKENYDKRVIT